MILGIVILNLLIGLLDFGLAGWNLHGYITEGDVLNLAGTFMLIAVGVWCIGYALIVVNNEMK